MSLGIVFKGPEGIVLAADSRVTLTAQQKAPDGTVTVLPSTFDNATKLLNVSMCSNVGVVTYGLGAFGTTQPRTAHSFVPEFEKELGEQAKEISTLDFSKALSTFFMVQWEKHGMPPTGDYKGPDMVFLIGGYDGEAYGKVFEVQIPRNPNPKEWHENNFGPIWGGQQETVARIIRGYDPRVLPIVQQFLGVPDEKMQQLEIALGSVVEMRIPYPFLPLQDCIDLSILLIETTKDIQSYYVGVRGVGGSIDVATITRTGGFQPYREKPVAGLYRKEQKK